MQQFTTEKQTQTLEDILIKEKRWEKIKSKWLKLIHICFSEFFLDSFCV